ncbi:MAG: hypothetical protein NTV99_10530 [Deltaproteobacteria bacterium]|nr:hypothetical protein [Deltaproteobacteria bacterium]
MKKLLLLALAIAMFLAIPSLCAAQKCRVVTGKKLMTFASPNIIYHWFKIEDKETASNYINRLNDTGQIAMINIGTQVYTIDRVNFSLFSVNDFPVFQIADFKTKKALGWILGEDVKGLKPCK